MSFLNRLLCCAKGQFLPLTGKAGTRAPVDRSDNTNQGGLKVPYR